MSFSIVTRYNVRSSFSVADVNDPEWLAVRRDLFARFCAPFVRAQTDQDFAWFVFVDTDMPQEESDWLVEVGGCQIIRCGSQTDGINQIRDLISTGYDLALMVRLDSDDSIAPTFVEQMRNVAQNNAAHTLEGGEGFVVCFGDGAEHDTQADAWFDRHYPGNPFIGFLEPVLRERPARLIFHHAHYEMPKKYDTLTVRTDEPMWCIRVHGGNVANVVKGVARGAVPASFSLETDTAGVI